MRLWVVAFLMRRAVRLLKPGEDARDFLWAAVVDRAFVKELKPLWSEDACAGPQ